GRRDLRFEGRIVAATNADLGVLIDRRQFREDLYFRLAVVELRIPPLRERPDEIPPLARRFAQESAERQGLAVPELDDAAVSALRAHDWPGNVRELRNRVERAVALSDGPVLGAPALFPEMTLDRLPARDGSLASAREQ